MMNERTYEQAIARLIETADKLSHEGTTVNLEPLLDAVNVINELAQSCENYESLLSNLRAELQRVRAQEGVY